MPLSRMRALTAFAAGAVVVAGAPALALTGNTATPASPVSAAGYRLPNGWHLDPAGQEVMTERGPTGLALASDGKHVVVATSGLFDEGLDVVNTTSLAMVPSIGTEFFRNPAIAADGTVYAANGSLNRIGVYKLAGPTVVPKPPVTVSTPGWPGPIVTAPDGRVFVGGTVSTEGTCPGAPPCSDLDILRGRNVHTVAVGRDAIALARNPKHPVLYVANWADASVSVVDIARSGAEHLVQTIAAGQHPLGLAVSPDGSRLAVTNAADDTVTIVQLGTTGLATATSTVSLRLTPGAPLGTMPAAAAYDPSGAFLYVALSGLNAVEVLTPDGQPIARTLHVDGATVQVPHTWLGTGWWPDAMLSAKGPGASTRLYVTNLRGDGSGPGLYPEAAPIVGSRLEGSLSVITLPSAHARAATFDRWTAQVVADDQLAPLYNSGLPDPARDACLPAPDGAGGSVRSAVLCAASRGQIDPRTLHVLIINNENKTFDSYFGDIKTKLPDANANPAFTEYGYESTPNQHRLAEQYNVDDSFYTDGDSSIEGHEWLTGGYETDANALTWGQQYDENIRGNRDSASLSSTMESDLRDPRSRLADEVATSPSGLTEAIYGDDLNRDSPALANQYPLRYWGLGPDAISGKDMTFPDVDRAQMFMHGTTISHAWNWLQGPVPPPTFLKRISLSTTDKQRFTLDAWTAAYKSCRASGGDDATCQRAMPNFEYLLMPVNHTYVINNGFNPLDPTPHAEVADNDDGVGQLIAGLSRSPFWKNTLVMLTQDDTQYTGDHVDIHRSFLLTMGGLARRLGPLGRTAHQPGSYPAAMKTAEVLLGLAPLSIFDWRAVPLADVVGDAPSAAPAYHVVRPATAFLIPPPWTARPPAPATLR